METVATIAFFVVAVGAIVLILAETVIALLFLATLPAGSESLGQILGSAIVVPVVWALAVGVTVLVAGLVLAFVAALAAASRGG